MRILVALLLLAAAPAAKHASGPAGHYRLSGGPDAASEIVLKPDGRFAFFLMEGALDEHAEGRWTAEGRRIRLETLPRPRPPVFTAAGAGKAAEGPLSIAVKWPDGRGIALIDLRVGFDAGAPAEGYTQEDGWTLDPAETRTPRWVELGLDMYGIGYTRFPVDLAKGNALAFTLTPNDLGVMDFTGVEVEAEPGALVFHGPGGEGRYVRQAR